MGHVPDEIADVLGKNEVFAGLGPEDLGLLARHARRSELRAGQRIFNLGEEAKSLLVVESGRVALMLPLVIQGTSKEVTVDEKGAGSVVAWSALVPPHRFTLSAMAGDSVQIIAFDRADLASELGAHPDMHLKISTNLNRVIAGRLAMMEALLIRQLQHRVDEKEL